MLGVPALLWVGGARCGGWRTPVVAFCVACPWCRGRAAAVALVAPAGVRGPRGGGARQAKNWLSWSASGAVGRWLRPVSRRGGGRPRAAAGDGGRPRAAARAVVWRWLCRQRAAARCAIAEIWRPAGAGWCIPRGGGVVASLCGRLCQAPL